MALTPEDVITWGENADGQCGQGERAERGCVKPRSLKPLQGLHVAQVVCGRFHTLCVTATSQARLAILHGRFCRCTFFQWPVVPVGCSFIWPVRRARGWGDCRQAPHALTVTAPRIPLPQDLSCQAWLCSECAGIVTARSYTCTACLLSATCTSPCACFLRRHACRCTPGAATPRGSWAWATRPRGARPPPSRRSGLCRCAQPFARTPRVSILGYLGFPKP